MKNNKAILVTGSHRSGTTWIGRTLCQHPRMRYVFEPFNVDHPNGQPGIELDAWFTHQPESERSELIRDYFDRLLTPHPLRYAADRCARSGPDLKTPLRFTKHFLLEAMRPPRLLIKDPIALLSAGWLHDTYGLPVIVMIRNPFAFVGSVKKAGWDFDFENLRKQRGLMQGWMRGFVDDVDYLCTAEGKGATDIVDRAAVLWNILHFAIDDYRSRYPQWLFMRHEDISTEPEAGFRRIFDYVDLEFGDDVLDYIRRYTSQGNPAETPTTTYRPRDSKSTLQTWKERLTADETARVRATTGDIAARFYPELVEQALPRAAPSDA